MEQLLPHRMLGRTGRLVSILGLGGGGLFFREENHDLAFQVLNRAIDLSIDYLDTAPGYGASESLFGEVLKSRRDEVFLATKVHPRSRDEAWRTIENSLKRLQTDHIELIQVHEIESDEDVDKATGGDGSIKAMEEARDQGIVKWIGVTGHTDPAPLLYALDRYDFDTVLMPVNIADKHYLSFLDNILPKAQERNLGVIGMKIYCAGGVFLNMDMMPEEALRYALSQPISTGVVGVDNMDQLLYNIDVARQFEPMGERQMRILEDRTKFNEVVCNAKFKYEPG